MTVTADLGTNDLYRATTDVDVPLAVERRISFERDG